MFHTQEVEGPNLGDVEAPMPALGDAPRNGAAAVSAVGTQHVVLQLLQRVFCSTLFCISLV
jgi:hypothetical protein